jgi:NitT/TauT family transport system ATP-binding protein
MFVETIAAVRGSSGAIQICDVAFRRDHSVVLGGVSCLIGAGEHVAIVGRSGAGKSTLLHLIAGLLRPLSGRVLIDDVAVSGPAHGVVLMFQRPALLPWATASENVLLPLRFSGDVRRDPTGSRRRVRALLEQIGLSDRAAALPTELSGGQQQRVALARALASNPHILLLDEPFSALDPETRATLRQDVRRLARARRATLVTVTHDLADAAALADRALLLAGSPASIVDDIALGRDAELQLRARFADLRDAA